MPRRYTPQEREARAREDYHDPTAGIGGAPAARSALTMRLILASFGLIACATDRRGGPGGYARVLQDQMRHPADRHHP